MSQRPMYKRWQFWVRLILTAALIYGAYTETGPFTAAVLVLITAAIEVIVWTRPGYREINLLRHSLWEHD